MVNSEIKCPNCFKILLTKPKRKKECPHCGKFIFVRNTQLVTEDESVITDWLEFFEEFQIQRHYIYESREKLKVKTGHQPTVPETIWEILNELLGKFEEDDFVLEQIYLAMARLGSSEDKDPTEYLLEADRLNKQYQKKLSDELDIEESEEDDEEGEESDENDEDEDNEEEYRIPGKEILLGHEELAYVRRLRKKGEFNKAEIMLIKAMPSPAVLDELRKLASTRARIAKQSGDWISVFNHLEGYNEYADKWRNYCVKMVNQEPPSHVTSDNKLLQEAKRKLGQ